jgi:uncharacterized sulfatase
MRFPFLPLAAFVVLLSGVVRGESPPHIVLFLADDLSWSDCSVYARSGIETPNMERIAREGMLLTHAFVASPSCAPSRGALLTGLFPARNGAMFNHQRPRKEVRTWPDYFKSLGYETAAIGKTAHYAQVGSYGFDHASHFKYHEDTCIKAAVDWLANRKSQKPLCLIVGTNWPHVPWPKESRYEPEDLPLPPSLVDTPETRNFRARYAEAVSLADRDLGLVYDAVRKRLGDNVLFLFTADHGAQLPFGKWNGYDAGLRTPLIAVWPGKIKPGSTSDALVSWVDLLPTCLAAVGAPAPESLDGKSFLPALRGEKQEHRDLIYATHSGDGKMNEYPLRVVRSRDWKYIRNLRAEAEYHTHIDKAQPDDGVGYFASWIEAARSEKHAAAMVKRYFHRPAEELYDLKADPHELKNLAGDPAHASRLAELRSHLDRWMKSQRDEGLATEEKLKP